jgi:hypothetical protein
MRDEYSTGFPLVVHPMLDLDRRLTLALQFCLTLAACGGAADDTGATGGTTLGATDSAAETAGTTGATTGDPTDAPPTTGALPTTGNDTDPSGATPCEASGWTVTPLADVGISGLLPALTVDSAGTLHLVYGSGYARRPEGGEWTTEPIAEMFTNEPAIAVDMAGGVHVAEADYQQPLHYIERTPDAVWQPAVQLGEDTSKNTGPIDLVLGGDQTVHIVYLDPKLLHWQRGADKVWSSESPIADDPVHAPSLAVEGEDLRLCLRNPVGIRCLHRPAGGAWKDTHEAATSVPLGDLGLAIEPGGRHHVIYLDDATLSLEYINVKFLSLHGDPLGPVASGVLDIGVVINRGMRPPKLAVDATGAVHAVWGLALIEGGPAVRHARLAPGTNDWTVSTIACSEHDNVGLAINAEGPHVVYAAYPHIFYARPDGG